MRSRLAVAIIVVASISACEDDEPIAPQCPAPVADPFVSWAGWRDCDSVHVELQVGTDEPWVFCGDTSYYLRRTDGSRVLLEFDTFAELVAPDYYRFTGSAALADVGDVTFAKAIGGRAGEPACLPRIDAGTNLGTACPALLVVR